MTDLIPLMAALPCNVYRACPALTDNFDGIACRCSSDHNYGLVTVDIDERECECRLCYGLFVDLIGLAHLELPK